MKKLFTLSALCLALSASATDYTDNLVVTINGESTAPQQNTISVTNLTDQTCDLELKNFFLGEGSDAMPVGNIRLEAIPVSRAGEAVLFSGSQAIDIAAGDAEGVGAGDWLGPMLAAQIGKIPVSLNGVIKGDKLEVAIDIDLAMFLGQVIYVQFGSGSYQLPNAGFEKFHNVDMYSTDKDGNWDTSKVTVSGDEPDHWHSFLSGSAELGNCKQANAILLMASNMGLHVYKSDAVRPGSTGQSSVLLKSTWAFIAIANGTITTGRLNAASASVSKDASSGQWLNHSWNDMSQTQLAPDGYPFYAEMTARPDSIVAWVKFAPSKDVTSASGYAAHPYASLNAVINDGSYYQDPQNTAPVDGDIRPSVYNNVVGTASNRQIAECDWTRLAIPFEYAPYVADNATPKTILVTASTNADAACGGKNDEMYLDDMELIYNHKLTSISYKGQALAGFDTDQHEYAIAADGDFSLADITYTSDAADPYIAVSEEKADGQSVVTIKVTSADLKQSTVYTLTVTTASAIESVSAATDETKAPAYNLAGQRTSAAAKGIIIKGGKKILK